MDIKYWIYTTTVITVLYIVLAIIVGDTLFSPDSWAYFELAQTIFSDDPYGFTTWRSYFSSEYSASFPFGYPIFYGFLYSIFSTHLVSVWGNLFFVPASLFMLFYIKKSLSSSSTALLLLGGGMLLYPGYMMEVLSGRSIPMAIFLFLCAFWLCLRRSYFLMGLALGAATLVRFDMLVASFLLGLGTLVLMKQRWKASLIIVGFFVAAFPWILYSNHHFATLWVSDNSWVAMSGTSAFVLDYPAKASITAQDNPFLWLTRVLGNFPKLLIRLAISTLKFSVLWGLVYACFQERKTLSRLTRRDIFIFGLMAVSLFPYILTGYFDERYFLLFFVAIGIWGVYTLKLVRVSMWGFVICWGIMGAWGVQQSLSMSMRRSNEALLGNLQQIARCHQKESQHTYIFFGKSKRVGPQYGARFHLPTAIAPSNFSSMTAEEKNTYFTFMGAHRRIFSIPEDIPCTQ